MQQFEFVLKNEKRKLYDRFAVFVFILNGLAIVYFLAYAGQRTIEKTSFLVLLLLLLFAFLFFLYRVSKRELRVAVTADYIIYPSFPKRVIQWSELNNIVLKDELLTIDFKNNKIIQQLIENSSPTVNEKEFNEFCKQQLRK